MSIVKMVEKAEACFIRGKLIDLNDLQSRELASGELRNVIRRYDALKSAANLSYPEIMANFPEVHNSNSDYSWVIADFVLMPPIRVEDVQAPATAVTGIDLTMDMKEGGHDSTGNGCTCHRGQKKPKLRPRFQNRANFSS